MSRMLINQLYMLRDHLKITFKQEVKRRVKVEKERVKARKEVWKVPKNYNKKYKPI